MLHEKENQKKKKVKNICLQNILVMGTTGMNEFIYVFNILQ